MVPTSFYSVVVVSYDVDDDKYKSLYFLKNKWKGKEENNNDDVWNKNKIQEKKIWKKQLPNC